MIFDETTTQMRAEWAKNCDLVEEFRKIKKKWIPKFSYNFYSDTKKNMLLLKKSKRRLKNFHTNQYF